MGDRDRSAVSACLLAIVASAVAVLLRWLLDPVLGEQLPLVTLFGAIAVAVWFGGYGPALLAVVVGYVACDYLFIEPRFAFSFVSVKNLVGLIAYLLTSSVIIGFGQAMRDGQRRAAEEREHLRVTLASIGDAVITTDAEGLVTYLNAVGESLTGWPQSDAIGQPLDRVFRIVNEQSRKPVEDPVKRALREGVIVGLANHTILIAKDGTERPVDDSAAPIKDAKGRVLGVVMVFRDVTERRHLERLQREQHDLLEHQVSERTAELQASEEKFRLLVDGTKDHAIFMLDPGGRVVSWNPGAQRIKQYTAGEIIGQHFSRFYPADDVQSGNPERALQTAAAKGKYEEEGWRIRKDGTRYWASAVITALRDDAGNLRGFSKVLRDSTERKQAEESARRLLEEETARRVTDQYNRVVEAQREQMRVTLTSIGDGVTTTNAQGRVTLLNTVAEALTGWTNEEAAGQPLEKVFHIVNERTKQVVEDPVAKVLATGRIVGLANHTVLIAKDGTERPIADSAAPIRDESGRTSGVVLVFRDVTQRRREEATLRRQADLLEQTHDAIFVWQLRGPIVYWNAGAEHLYGFSKQEAVGKVSHELLATIFPEGDRAAFEAAIERHGEFRGELIHTKKNGERITVESLNRLMTESDGQQFVLETSRDVTERKTLEMELRRKVEELAVADRRKDEFLATLAHELRNPLAPIRNAIQVLLMKGPPDRDLKWGREVIERQVKHMSRLLDDLLDVSRISYNKLELRKEPVDLSSVIQMAVETSHPLIDGGGHELTVDLPAEPVYVDVDPVRLAQIISNLLNNAARYTGKGGHIRLTAARQGDEIIVSVKDDGIGVAAEMLPRIFDIGSQGHPAVDQPDSGLGIGLWLVRGLVELHGGSVDARSDGPGKGSEFIVRLPVVLEAGVQQVAIPTQEVKPRVVKRRLLIVDDLKDGADSLAKVMELMGHEVRTAYSGEEAVIAAATFQPELVLLDIGMPKVNGYDACRAIRERPWGKQMFVIALTGWSQERDRRRTEEAGFDDHLVKPVDPDVLARLLASLPAERQSAAPAH
jgi:PAS domain S-box-containing protein